MKTYKIDDCLVHAVEDIEDVTQIKLYRGHLLGLDVESNGKDPFADGFEVRLVQIATENEAYVFRMDQDWQSNYVRSTLVDDTTSFVSHTDYDTMAVWNYLGVDISHRNIDTRMLATMAAPDDKIGGVDLKSLVESVVSELEGSSVGVPPGFIMPQFL